MSVEERWARTDEQIGVLHRARRQGGLCSWCGRDLAETETIYIERFLVGTRQPRGGSDAQPWSTAYAPVGAECASLDLLERTAGQMPDPCGYCGRRVFYRQILSRRQQILCSRRCGSHLLMQRQKARAVNS